MTTKILPNIITLNSMVYKFDKILFKKKIAPDNPPMLDNQKKVNSYGWWT